MVSLHHRLAFVVSATVLLVFTTGSARAGEPTDQLREHVDRVMKTLDDPALKGDSKAAERRAAVRKISDEIFDVPEVSKRTLGPHWQARPQAEREEFVRLFGELLEQSYISKIDRYQGEKVRYTGESREGDQAVVRTVIVTPQGSEIPVDYRMSQRDGRWRVYDVVIESVSLVANYRSQFNKIIQTASYQDLVQKLRSKALSTPEDGKARRGPS